MQVFLLHDTLHVEESNDLKLPEWTVPIYPDKLLDVKKRTFQLFTETAYMKRIRGGPLVSEIFEQMQQKQNGDLSRNFAIYSAHDSTVFNLMRALNVDDQIAALPGYGATLAFELHCHPDEECYVQVSAIHPSMRITFLHKNVLLNVETDSIQPQYVPEEADAIEDSQL